MSGMKRQPHKRVNYEVDDDDFFFSLLVNSKKFKLNMAYL